MIAPRALLIEFPGSRNRVTYGGYGQFSCVREREHPVFKTRILTYNNNDIHDPNNRWSIQQIRQWLIVCYDQPRHQDSYFFKCWLRDLDSTGHLLRWRPGCQYVILQLLEWVFKCKIEHEAEATENIETA